MMLARLSLYRSPGMRGEAFPLHVTGEVPGFKFVALIKEIL